TGPGTAPALCGPTLIPPPSIQAIEPPPEPIVCILTMGDKIGNFSILTSDVTSGSPSIIILTSKLVPPISTQIKLRSEEHTSELQSRFDLVCRLLLEKKNKKLL